jgi:N-acetyl-gamma-glutamyl-phosphate reductase
MDYKIFVDGQEGTTGLKINERLKNHKHLSILKIDKEHRKDTGARREMMNLSDIAFLCLPDVASKEAVSLVTNPNTRIIDASTAFRTHPDWAYGFPELSGFHREKIATSKRVSVPGCHATGFTAAIYPLIRTNIMPKDYPITAQSITGYSGGGKSLIAKYEENRTDDISLKSPNFYALGLSHKHLPEMQKVNNLLFTPIFSPIVGDFYQGMVVSIPLFKNLLTKKMDAKELHSFFSDYYKNEKFIRVMPFEGKGFLDNGFLAATKCNDTNMLELFVFGHDDQILLVSRLDNLGKGASGAAVQCMNIMLGLDEETCLK